MIPNANFAFSDGKEIIYEHEPWEILVSIVKFTNCKNYLELGVDIGITFEQVFPLVERCVGVDIVDKRSQKIGEFYNETTDDFFSHFTDEMNIIFVDADHSFESVKQDLENSLKILSKYGIIFLHDTDPHQFESLDCGFCCDAYKIHDFIEDRTDLTYVTLPIASTGLTIVKRKEDRRVLNFTDTYES
jgi:predicted O-methyltransferase YrrM